MYAYSTTLALFGFETRCTVAGSLPQGNGRIGLDLLGITNEKGNGTCALLHLTPFTYLPYKATMQ